MHSEDGIREMLALTGRLLQQDSQVLMCIRKTLEPYFPSSLEMIEWKASDTIRPKRYWPE